METKTFKEVKKFCSPLIKLEPLVKAIWIYGSSVKKEKGNDIDILVLVDDTMNLTQKKLDQISRAIELIERKSPEDLLLHFQRPILLTKWWSLIVKGEPWAITAIKRPLIVYDDSGYVDLMNKMLKKKDIYGKEIKAERLVERANELLTENRKILLTTVEDLFMAANESVQIFLLTKNKILFNSKNILKEMERYINVDVYREISDLNNKVNKGSLSEFTGENLDYYSRKVKNFIEELEKLTINELKRK